MHDCWNLKAWICTLVSNHAYWYAMIVPCITYRRLQGTYHCFTHVDLWSIRNCLWYQLKTSQSNIYTLVHLYSNHNHTRYKRACITHGWKIVCDVIFSAHGWANQTMWDVCGHRVKKGPFCYHAKKRSFYDIPNISGLSAWVDLTMVIYYCWVRSLFDLPKGNDVLTHNHLLVDES